MRPKGMQCIPSLRGISERKVLGLHGSATAAGTGSRARVATALARLEHERAGLTNRLDNHSAIRAELEVRLQHVNEQLAELRTQLFEISEEEGASSEQAAQDVTDGSLNAEGASAYKVVSLEY